jgi:hypothetical protein
MANNLRARSIRRASTYRPGGACQQHFQFFSERTRIPYRKLVRHAGWSPHRTPFPDSLRSPEPSQPSHLVSTTPLRWANSDFAEIEIQPMERHFIETAKIQSRNAFELSGSTCLSRKISRYYTIVTLKLDFAEQKKGGRPSRPC